MSDALDVTAVLKSDVPTIDEWYQSKEYEYDRVESKVVDYLNAVIDFGRLDEAVTGYSKGTNFTNWNELFEECSIEIDSDASTMAKIHIRSYCDARSMEENQ